MAPKREGGSADGKKRKYQRTDHQGGKGPGLPLGKQGILITVERADAHKATREAINVLTDVYEELVQSLPTDATAAATVSHDPASSSQGGAEGAADAQAPADTQGAQKGSAASEEPKVAPTGGDAGAAAAGDAAAQPAAAAPASDTAGAVGGDAAGAATDYSSLIAKEVTTLKDKKQQHFCAQDTGIRTLLFLELLHPLPGAGPCEVVTRLLEQAQEKKLLQFRFCTRFLPCTHICKADLSTIKTTARALVRDRMDCSENAKAEAVAVLYEHRAAPADLKRTEVIDAVVEPVPRPPHKVDLTNATQTLSCQVVKNACGMAVLSGYNTLGKYNIKTVTADTAAADT